MKYCYIHDYGYTGLVGAENKISLCTQIRTEIQTIIKAPVLSIYE